MSFMPFFNFSVRPVTLMLGNKDHTFTIIVMLLSAYLAAYAAVRINYTHYRPKKPSPWDKESDYYHTVMPNPFLYYAFFPIGKLEWYTFRRKYYLEKTSIL